MGKDEKMIIYQVFTRLFGNNQTESLHQYRKHNGKRMR